MLPAATDTLWLTLFNETRRKSMASKRTFYRTVIRVEVLSEEFYDPEDLAEVSDDTIKGPCSGNWTITEQQEVDGPTMATLLMAQGSGTEFFQLDEKGNDLDEEVIEVEYDEGSSDGNNAEGGSRAYIPAKLVEEVGMEQAFNQTTGIDPVHIIRWSEGEIVTREDIQNMEEEEEEEG
jgi:hypothetical protein